MKKKNYFKEALSLRQGKQLCVLFFSATILSMLICIFASHTKLVYLALAFSMAAVSSVNNFTLLISTLRQKDDEQQNQT